MSKFDFPSIIAEQVALEQSLLAPNEPKDTRLHWFSAHAVEPRERQAVDWIGSHGETVPGIYLGGDRWQRSDTGLMLPGGQTPSLWRPRTLNTER